MRLFFFLSEVLKQSLLDLCGPSVDCIHPNLRLIVCFGLLLSIISVAPSPSAGVRMQSVYVRFIVWIQRKVKKRLFLCFLKNNLLRRGICLCVLIHHNEQEALIWVCCTCVRYFCFTVSRASSYFTPTLKPAVNHLTSTGGYGSLWKSLPEKQSLENVIYYTEF